MAKNRVVSGQRSEVGEQRSENREQRSVEGEGSFAERQAEAESKRGIVAPNLADAVVEVVNVPKHDFTGTGKEALRKAEKWAKENLVGEHIIRKGQKNEFSYSIDNEVISKFLSSSSTKNSENLGVHLATLKMLPSIIEKSILAESHPDYAKANGKRSALNGVDNKNVLIHRLYGAAVIDSNIYRIKTTIYENKDSSNKPHDFKVTKIELLISGSSTSNALSNSNIGELTFPVANLLQGVRDFVTSA